MTSTGEPFDALHQKYLDEREKRLRADGAAQYADMTGDLARYVQDPYTERTEREPIEEDLDVLVGGGGFAGMLAGVKLIEQGIGTFRIVETGGDFGGTWYWNRYPGIACDIESYIYMPLLEEVGHMPTERYTRGDEIREHSQNIGKKFGLYEKACFQTRVTDIKWAEHRQRWVVRTDRGDRFAARFLVLGTGPLSRPKLPGIPGLKDFKGHSFHTSRWDYAYTGGNSKGGLTGLADKRVAPLFASPCDVPYGQCRHGTRRNSD